jgi:hypothetical protein
MRTFKLLLAGWMALSAVTATTAQTADEIVKKHVDAIGGADNWKKINSTRVEGSFNVQGNDVSITITRLQGKGMRQDISVAGMSGYVIITPTAGTTYLPFQGQSEAQPMPADALKEGQYQLDVQGVLVDYKTKGHTVELLGKETIDGAECNKLKVTLAGGKVFTYYIDTKNNYLVRSVTTQHVNGQEMEQTVSFGNFQKLPEGITVPMTITQQFGEVILSKMEINKAVDESIFKG